MGSPGCRAEAFEKCPSGMRDGAAFVFQALQAQAFTAWTLDQPERIG